MNLKKKHKSILKPIKEEIFENENSNKLNRIASVLEKRFKVDLSLPRKSKLEARQRLQSLQK